jgi:transposase
VRYYGLYGNAHRGKVRKAQIDKHPSIIVEEENPRVPHRGWAEIRRKVFEVDPLTCPSCGSRMRIIAFITDYALVDRIINHLNLTFVAERPPPPHVASQ